MVMPGNHLLLKFLRLDSPVVPRPTGIITLRDRALSPLAELFIDRVRTLARPLAKLR